ncbi:MAG: FAD-binding oxidoreductase [Deltaproteobacteria bacterium]|nr:MAG: FAD-binding oxidoreductase [Deltaproteobacteria bacterium]
MRPVHVLVIGAGIFGVAAALELRARGCRVTLVDPGPLPHPLAESTDISKIVRCDYGADEDYTALAERALDGWRRWNADWPVPRFHETGVAFLTYGPMQPGSFEHDSFTLLARRGHRVERLDAAAIAARFPAYRPGAFTDGYFHHEGGWASPSWATTPLAASSTTAPSSAAASSPPTPSPSAPARGPRCSSPSSPPTSGPSASPCSTSAPPTPPRSPPRAFPCSAPTSRAPAITASRHSTTVSSRLPITALAFISPQTPRATAPLPRKPRSATSCATPSPPSPPLPSPPAGSASTATPATPTSGSTATPTAPASPSPPAAPATPSSSPPSSAPSSPTPCSAFPIPSPTSSAGAPASTPGAATPPARPDRQPARLRRTRTRTRTSPSAASPAISQPPPPAPPPPPAAQPTWFVESTNPPSDWIIAESECTPRCARTISKRPDLN